MVGFFQMLRKKKEDQKPRTMGETGPIKTPKAHHHQSSVETSGGAGVCEEPHQVKDPQCDLLPAPISLTESFLHKLGCFDTQCAEMLLLHWWGFTLAQPEDINLSTTVENYVNRYACCHEVKKASGFL